jgi:hypothetical protein
MIKARYEDAGTTPTVLLGLSGENITRLVAGEPLLADLAELGLSTRVVIVYGKTEAAIAAELRAHGALPPES